MLGPHVDEIELLLFESKTEGCLPSREEIDLLLDISKAFSLTYNVHLPTDVSLASSDRSERDKAVDTLRRVMEMTAELGPTNWTLHVPFDESQEGGADIVGWQGRARTGIGRLIDGGIPARRLAVENLDYPFGWIQKTVQDLDLGICMDVGHLLIGGEDIAAFFREHAERITIIHLHGAKNQKDHLPLNVLPEEDGLSVVTILERFSKTLSVEVFSYDNLAASMEWLEKMMR